MKILIGGAWPYANGSLHIGHLAGLLPADVIARYHRLKGDDVYYVSGSDCHGTPVAIRARIENKAPSEISDFYHNEFCECFNALGFSYDRYGKTASDEHINFVRAFHAQMYDGPYVYEKETPQAYCEKCAAHLVDRLVTGVCPNCGKPAKGDQCDACGSVLDPESLLEPKCAVCGGVPTFNPTKHLFINIKKLESRLTAYIDSHPEWRKNAIAFSRRYIDEGLRDRALTRALSLGIDVPRAGYEDKKIYIWAENVLGYLSMSKVVCGLRGNDYADIWGEDARHYYVHGKDNIPFHTIILPSLMLAHGGPWRLPDVLVSSEFMTLEGRKISTSENWAIWVKDIAGRYHPDSIRYFFIANGPEKKDADFTWLEFVNSHNGELLGAYGNFINRTLAFVYKYFGAAVPSGPPDEAINQKIAALYASTGEKIENGDLKEALDGIFEFTRSANKYFDTQKPWETRNTDIVSCETAIFNCVHIIANLVTLLEPFLPFSSAKVKKWLNVTGGWEQKTVKAGFVIPEPEILFERLDKSVAETEVERLKAQL